MVKSSERSECRGRNTYLLSMIVSKLIKGVGEAYTGTLTTAWGLKSNYQVRKGVLAVEGVMVKSRSEEKPKGWIHTVLGDAPS